MDQKGLQLSLEERRAIGDNLEKSLKEAIHLSKGKVFLANQAYDTVDKYIRRLDNDINRFQVALARHQSEKFGEGMNATVMLRKFKFFIGRTKRRKRSEIQNGRFRLVL